MVGKTRSTRRDWKDIPQLTWEEILYWMRLRYVTYKEQKANNQQWDAVGIRLYKLATEEYKDCPDEFVRHCLRQAGISDY